MKELKLIGAVNDGDYLIYTFGEDRGLIVDVEESAYKVFNSWLSTLKMSDSAMAVLDTHENEEKALKVIEENINDIIEKLNKLRGASDDSIEAQNELLEHAAEHGNLIYY